MSNKIINGYWDGQPIWRNETAEDRLMKALWEKGIDLDSIDLPAEEVARIKLDLDEVFGEPH